MFSKVSAKTLKRTAMGILLFQQPGGGRGSPDKTLRAEPEELNVSTGPTQWKERTHSWRLSSELHTLVVACTHTHTHKLMT